MSRESKILKASNEFSAETVINHYESFGWELLSIDNDRITMTRETQNEHFVELVKYQAKYEEKMKEYNAILFPFAPTKPYPIEASKCFWSFVALVIPFVIYITVKIRQKKKYNEAFNVYTEQCRALTEKKKALRAEMEDIALQSRGVFFGKA